jgi:hypothetical protein
MASEATTEFNGDMREVQQGASNDDMDNNADKQTQHTAEDSLGAKDSPMPDFRDNNKYKSNSSSASYNNDGPAMLAKRRKVRKGTRSCWECKRRKIRCIFSSPEDAACISCLRRRIDCVGQELPEDLCPARIGSRHLGDRISKVEDLMQGLLAKKSADGTERSRDRQEKCPADKLPVAQPPSASRAPLTPVDVSGSKHAWSATRLTWIQQSIEEAGPPSESFPRGTHASGRADLDSTLQHLFAAFPNENDAKILFRESLRASHYTEIINTKPHSHMTHEILSAHPTMQELPSRAMHPVILAKRMLIFAITLQSPDKRNIVALSEPREVLMHRLASAAATWVTTREEMHGTLESLVCILLEASFEVNCGRLRRAWTVYRRAMTVAQLMGLHRSPMPPLKRIDKGHDADPEYLWFRIVYMDRYLSLLLGLPQGTMDKSMATSSVLRQQPALGIFDRLLTVIASRILERNEQGLGTSEITTTQAIDAELLRASKIMPESFWRPASYSHIEDPGSADAVLENARMSSQVYYYGMLIHLHLPYMIATGSKVENEYSKMTCVNAGREIVTRFIAHRTFNPLSSCARPVDFFALLAAMTILLAHLDTHYQLRQGVTNFLAHQRLSDRALLEQSLERMAIVHTISNDAITEKSAALIRKLMQIEADASEGTKYTTRSVSGDDGVEEGMEDGVAFRLPIPYLGMIRIFRQGNISSDLDDQYSGFMGSASREPPLWDSHEGSDRSVVFDQPVLSDFGPSLDKPLQPDADTSVDDQEWTFQGVEMAFFDSLMGDAAYIDTNG